MISGVTYSSCIKGEVFKFLGKLSMPMFIFHWGIGSLANILTDNLKQRFFILLYWDIASCNVSIRNYEVFKTK